ncbi:RNA-binding cell elongation regulator Jag/EloR [Filibacter tadaridae]|uniref:RNA-binding protein KhpB n=1 Tax=Filibacter tadaridae TaxID=2483811 RepID=A0A3P5WSW4_9BACL|nr:RNA-binding cell elongation regulator Jag/EloR [Filibacter tadaridae]VDC21706.1 R3H domain protein [Filibacter tadaridae]
MKKVTRRGPTVELAITSALAELGATRDEVNVEVNDKGKKGFLGFGVKEAEVTLTMISVNEPFVTEEVAVPKEELKIIEPEKVDVQLDMDEEKTSELPGKSEELEKVREKDISDEAAIEKTAQYLKMMAVEMGIEDIQVSQVIDGKYVTFHLESDKAAILIGKRGQTLNALQQLAQLVANKFSNEFKVVRVEIGDYRERREQSLQLLADRMADKAVRSGRKVQLEPMPSYERKVIHHTLSNRPDIETYSEGSDPYRYLVIQSIR